MADDWAIVSQTPAAQSTADPWAVVSQTPQPAQKTPFDRAGEFAGSMFPGGEVALQAVTGVASTVAGGLRGIYDSLSGEGASAAPNIQSTQQAGTYQPRSIGGQALSEVASYLPQKQAQAAKWAGGKVAQGATALGASPEVAGGLGATVETAGNVIGPSMLAKGLRAKPEFGPPKPPPAPGMVQKARAAGYVLKPSEADAPVGKVLEGATGSPRLSIEASLKNQPVTNSLAAEEIGIPKGTKITRDSLRRASAPHNAVYKAVSELGDIDTDETYSADIAAIGHNPGKSFKNVKKPDLDNLREQYADKYMDAADAVHEIKSLRSQSRKNLAAPFAPNQNELGFAQKQVADAIENQLERHAETLGKTDLVKRFKTARQELAKINTVRDALVGNTGNVSAAKLAKMQQKNAPLSGNLKLIADVADEFGEVTRDANKLKNKIPITVLEGGVGGAGLAMSALNHPVAGGAALLGTVARPLTRKYLLSERYQKKLAPGPKARKFTLGDLEE